MSRRPVPLLLRIVLLPLLPRYQLYLLTLRLRLSNREGHGKGAIFGSSRGTDAKAKLSGNWVDYSENKNNNMIYAIGDRPLTAEEWEQQC
jgi:hypothetical protein